MQPHLQKGVWHAAWCPPACPHACGRLRPTRPWRPRAAGGFWTGQLKALLMDFSGGSCCWLEPACARPGPLAHARGRRFTRRLSPVCPRALTLARCVHAQAHTGLTSLDLSENPIRDEGAIALAPALGSMQHLDRLLLASAAGLGWAGGLGGMPMNTCPLDCAPLMRQRRAGPACIMALRRHTCVRTSLPYGIGLPDCRRSHL